MLLIIAIIVGLLAVGSGFIGFVIAAATIGLIFRWLFGALFPAFIVLLILALVL